MKKEKYNSWTIKVSCRIIPSVSIGSDFCKKKNLTFEFWVSSFLVGGFSKESSNSFSNDLIITGQWNNIAAEIKNYFTITLNKIQSVGWDINSSLYLTLTIENIT